MITLILKIGEMFRLTYLKENSLLIGIKDIVNIKDEIKKELVISLLSDSDFKIKEIKFTLISIDDTKSYLSICHYFDSYENEENMKHLSKIKTNFLSKLKTFLENQ